LTTGQPLHRTRVGGLGLDVVFCLLISAVMLASVLS
jgi:uncharacterized iron-regulated membrane protein